MAEEVEHPSSDRLQAFLVGRLSDSESSSIEDHIETCAECRSGISSLPRSSDSFVDRLRVEASREPGPAAGVSHDISAAEVASSLRFSTAPPGYQILEEIGRGGMGVVYKSLHIRLNRLVALKMMLAGRSASRTELDRFRGEAEAIARLHHPNIVQIHEIGESEGQTYLALEYVAGGTLEQRINNKPQPPRQAAALVAVLARAMSEAHRKGIVHRDLKPGNILLDLEGDGTDSSGLVDGYGSPKVTDFGLAKWVTEDRGVSVVQFMAGTPSYMSPEQAARGPIGPATDIYALGAILYEMLTGRPPFQGTSSAETFALIEASDPVPPRRLQPKVSRDLETICLKCLERQPVRRYATARNLSEDLDRFLKSIPIRARRIGWVGRAVRQVKRRPAISGLVFTLLVVGALGLTGVFWQWGVAVVHRQRAEQALIEADDNLYFSRIAQAQLEWRLDNNVTTANDLLEACRPKDGSIDRRGWEWAYLKQLVQQNGRPLEPVPSEYLVDVGFSPDGQTAAAFGFNPFLEEGQRQRNQVTLWDVATGRRLQSLEGDGFAVRCLAFSPDGTRLAIGCARSVRVWDLSAWCAKGRPADQPLPSQDLVCEPGSIHGLAYSPDGRRLAAASIEKWAEVWDVPDGRSVGKLRLDSQAWGAAFLPDGRIALALIVEPRVELLVWDLDHDFPRRYALGEIRGPSRVKFSRDGHFVAVAGQRVLVCEVPAGRLVNVMGGGNQRDVMGIDFHPNGQSLAVALSDQTVRVWDRSTGTERLVLRGHSGRASAVAFHPSGEILLSGSQQPGEVKLWDLKRAPELSNFPPPGNYAVEAIAFDLSGDRLFAAFPGGPVEVIHPTTRTRSTLSAELTKVWLTPGTIAAFSDGGQAFAAVTGTSAKQVRTWVLGRSHGTEEFVERATIPDLPARVYQLALSGDGRRMASATLGPRGPGRSRVIRVHDATTGELELELPPQPAPAQKLYGGLRLSCDGTLLIYDDYEPVSDSVSPQAVIRVRDLKFGRDRFVLRGHAGVATALAVSPDGRNLASAEAGRILLWDLESGHRLHDKTLEGPTYQLAFSPDGKRLAGVDRQEVKLWDVRTGREVLLLRGASFRSADIGINPQIAWSPDGRRLAASNHDLTLSVWDASGPEEATVAK